MPPRLNKRLQREQEELEALRVVNLVKEEEDSEELNPIEQVASSSTAIGFAALIESGDEKEDEESSPDEVAVTAKSKKSKSKKKKKKHVAVAQLDSSTQSAPAKLPKSKKGETSSSKSGNKSSQAQQDDEFDRALAELSGKFSTSGLSSQNRLRGDSNQARALYSLLSVNLKNLDPEAELRRFFGSKVISTSGNAGPSTSHTSRIRSNLAKHQKTWPPSQFRAGLSMRELTPEEYEQKRARTQSSDRGAKSERWWTIEASPRYKAVTYEYLQGVMGGDPQLFFNLLYETPWHVDTLLQVAEVFRHREEHSTASDFTSRALFAYERSFSSAFNFTTGVHRLDFDRVENRVLYLALARHITDLNRRGTPQTAFEFARLLLGLDPHIDPQGALLYLDSFAIKAKQHDWLLKYWNTSEDMNMNSDEEATKRKQFNVTLLPGWHWSKALALFEQEGERDNAHVRSTEALKTAILTFPAVAPLLADKLDVTMKDELRRLDCFRIVTDYNTYRDDLSTSLLHLLSHIYVLRSSSIWKIPARINWFSKTLASIPLSSFSSTSLITQTRFKETFSVESSLTDSIYRHIIVVTPLIPDFRRLFSFFPDGVKTRMQESMIEGDPLPPLNAVSRYDDAYFLDLPVESRSGVGGQGGRGNTRNVVERLMQGLQGAIANPEQRRQLQEMLQAHPQFAERFPGGLEQLAEMVREFPNDVLNVLGGFAGDVADEDDELNHGDVHPMPGDLNVPRDEYDEDEGDQDEYPDPEEAEVFFPVRIIRNLTARFWGQNNNEVDVEGSETSHGEDSPVHTQDEVD